MATYTYACTHEACDQREFTIKRPMDEYKEPAPCPQCGKECERISSDFCKNFALKGGGWYNSGYSGKSNGGASWHSEALKAGKDPYKAN